MKTYGIEFARSAAKELKKLDRSAGKAVMSAIYRLASNPRPAAAKKLVGRPEWRLRVGDYRVIYDIYDSKLVILVLKVAHRRDVYR